MASGIALQAEETAFFTAPTVFLTPSEIAVHVDEIVLLMSSCPVEINDLIPFHTVEITFLIPPVAEEIIFLTAVQLVLIAVLIFSRQVLIDAVIVFQPIFTALPIFARTAPIFV